MTSFQISVSPSRRAAGRYITRVRRALQKALAEERKKTGLTQSEIARKIGVHRTVISREIRGQKDITVGRIGELAWAMGRKPVFELPEIILPTGSNLQSSQPFTAGSAFLSGQQIPAPNSIIAANTNAVSIGRIVAN
jgi:transcriptional regulator with XRE-family HTH domain